MKNNVKQVIKNSLIGGIVFSLTVLTFGLVYGTWTTISQETDGQPLTAAKWNVLVDRLNSINERSLATAWVKFDGTNCTGGAGNECVINDSFNVNKVERLSLGKFRLTFSTVMDNANYSFNGSAENANFTYGRNNITFYNVLTNSIELSNYNAGATAYVDEVISVQIFGGKTY